MVAIVKRISSVYAVIFLLIIPAGMLAGCNSRAVSTSPPPVSQSLASVSPSLEAKAPAETSRPSHTESDDALYERFIGLVLMYFEEKGMEVLVKDGSVIVQGEDELQFGLTNISQLCFQSDPLTWKRLIQDHFDNVIALLEPRNELLQYAEDYEQAKELLAVRIYHEDWIEELQEDHFIYRIDLEGTISVLVFDLPTSVRNVTPDEAEAWGKTHEELMVQALENTFVNYPQPGAYEQLTDTFGVWIFSDGSFFVATHALFLDYYEECIGEFGSLFGIPVRDALICYSIEGFELFRINNHNTSKPSQFLQNSEKFLNQSIVAL